MRLCSLKSGSHSVFWTGGIGRYLIQKGFDSFVTMKISEIDKSNDQTSINIHLN